LWPVARTHSTTVRRSCLSTTLARSSDGVPIGVGRR
jgi:hypothetical protein